MNMSKFNWCMRACGVFVLWATMAVALLAQTTMSAPPASTFTTLFSFDNTDGDTPFAGLVQGTDGTLYGTTPSGGANDGGTVFKITPSGTLTTIYNFCSQINNGICSDGIAPLAGLFQAANGDFYGTTVFGGANANRRCNGSSCGTVFKITPTGTLTTIYSFCSQANCTDGANPTARLIQATDGNLYGATYYGGTHGGACGYLGCGTVFTITPSGGLTTVHSFDGTDGKQPAGGLIQATNGNLYGTTYEGGANNCRYVPFGCGTVFKMTPGGELTTLYRFCAQANCTDGAQPRAGLVQATNGDFYGTTFYGGASPRGACLHHCGTVFKITPSGTLTTLHSFDVADGSDPIAGLVQATDGDLYGTTFYGGASPNGACLHHCGTVFKISPRGTLTTIHSFEVNAADGYDPSASLVQGTDGKFYGTTGNGGPSGGGDGTVFSLSVELRPFVETQPTSGDVGKAVKILGTNLTGATSVTFNGTAATFTVKSKTEITTTVPAGATTGTVQVVTPRRTLSSNVSFRVM
jgi:uncharacterized repeat protein (TIGR03803 family)